MLKDRNLDNIMLQIKAIRAAENEFSNAFKMDLGFNRYVRLQELTQALLLLRSDLTDMVEKECLRMYSGPFKG